MATLSLFTLFSAFPANAETVGDKIVTSARETMNAGVTYNMMDCSKFICDSYNKNGINIDAYRYDLRKTGTNMGTDLSIAIPGDILKWTCGIEGKGHVAIYTGNNKMIHSLNPTQNIMETPSIPAWAGDGYWLESIIRPSGISNMVQTIKEDWFWETNGNFWKYQLSDGSFAKGWKLISYQWYYFKADESLTWGCWERIDGKWYHFHEDGHMEKDWKEIDGKFYYFGNDGGMRENEWVDEYYLGSGGAMYRNVCATINGIEYDFNSEGKATAISEPKEQYSFRTRTQEYEYKISNSDSLDGWEYVEAVAGNSNEWGSWSDWSSDYVEGSDNIKVEKRTVDSGTKTQIYLGRYYSESQNAFLSTKKDESYSFEGGWFDNEEVTFRGEVFKGGRKDCYTISGYGYYFFEIGEHGGETREVSSGSQTEYRYRERLNNTQYKFRRYKYSGWSEWSSWSETPITPDELTDVKTQRN